MIIVYWSSRSENTHRFVQKLNIENIRLPINCTEVIKVSEPFILILPSYGHTEDTALPLSVKRFLNDDSNCKYLRGVIGCGNTDFGSKYCIAARTVSKMFNVELLYKLELFGTSVDVENVQFIIQKQSRKENGPES